MRLTKEREADIRQILSYRNDWTLSASHGRELLAEIDALRADLIVSRLALIKSRSLDGRISNLELAYKERDQLREKLDMAINALEKYESILAKIRIEK